MRLYQIGNSFINVDNILHMHLNKDDCLVVILATGSIRETVIYDDMKGVDRLRAIASYIQNRM